ncbi:MAG: hypothetical protein V3R65_06795 [Acidiferrobacterales bacterium]
MRIWSVLVKRSSKDVSNVRPIFSELGFEGDDLEMLTLLFASSASQDQLMFLIFSDEDYERQLKLHHDFFIRP